MTTIATTPARNFERALVWELIASSGSSSAVHGLRVAVAGEFLLMQELSRNERPRWTVEQHANREVAVERALAVTRYTEDTYGATLVADPTEVILHDSELRAMKPGEPIPASLRARFYTALQRRRHSADASR